MTPPVGITVTPTAIPGLLVVDLPVMADARGWFKETWQRAKMTALGVPDFGPVQANVSFNRGVGVTRGLHAEPWDKLVTLETGRVFGAWVDLRAGAGFGRTVTLEFGPASAIFVPRGVANGYQTLAPDTVYSYLVNGHWNPEARGSYTYVNLADETLALAWPIPLAEATLSDADAAHPRLGAVVPVVPEPEPGRTVVVGGDGQLGRALAALLPDAVALGIDELDIADPDAVRAWDFSGVGTVVNAAAYTDVDGAESGAGLAACWRTNVAGVAHLVEAARKHGFTLVHVSSDYVFDGTAAEHTEDEPASPLGVYGATKAAGDALVATLDRHYVVRTSWVIGDGRNFVTTMRALAASGATPRVVDDQVGRLTLASDLAAGIVHLLAVGAPYGTYNLTGSGQSRSWFEIAQRVFEHAGRAASDVTGVSTAEYASGQAAAGRIVAPRPRHSTLALGRIEATGFVPRDADAALLDHLARTPPHGSGVRP